MLMWVLDTILVDHNWFPPKKVAPSHMTNFLFGFIFFDAVYIVAVMNYAIQSELNIYLLHALRIKVERREHKTIDAAIKVSSHGNHIAAHMVFCLSSGHQ